MTLKTRIRKALAVIAGKFTRDADLAGCVGCGRPRLDVVIVDDREVVEAYCAACWDYSPGLAARNTHIRLSATEKRATWKDYDEFAEEVLIGAWDDQITPGTEVAQ